MTKKIASLITFIFLLVVVVVGINSVDAAFKPCPTGKIRCGTVCQAPSTLSGSSCETANGFTGNYNDCENCVGATCSSPKVICGGYCRDIHIDEGSSCTSGAYAGVTNDCGICEDLVCADTSVMCSSGCQFEDASMGGACGINGTIDGCGNCTGEHYEEIWQKDVGKAYYNNGNVGIGTSDPNHDLSIVSIGNPELTLRNNLTAEHWGIYNKATEIDGDDSLRFFWGTDEELDGDRFIFGNNGNFSLQGGIGVWDGVDYEFGTSGQMLSSTGSGLEWIDVSSGGRDALQAIYNFGGNNVLMTASIGDVRFRNSINDILFLDESSSYVGIGTSSPEVKLDIDGQVKIRGGSPGEGKVLTSDGTGLATWETPSASGGGGGDDGDWTISGSNMYSVLSGNVGIGTNGPDVSLEIKKDDALINPEVKLNNGDTSWGIYNDKGTDELRFWNEEDVLKLSDAGQLTLNESDGTTGLTGAGLSIGDLSTSDQLCLNGDCVVSVLPDNEYSSGSEAQLTSCSVRGCVAVDGGGSVYMTADGEDTSSSYDANSTSCTGNICVAYELGGSDLTVYTGNGTERYRTSGYLSNIEEVACSGGQCMIVSSDQFLYVDKSGAHERGVLIGGGGSHAACGARGCIAVGSSWIKACDNEDCRSHSISGVLSASCNNGGCVVVNGSSAEFCQGSDCTRKSL